jgi:hypothetical protein
VRNFAHYMRLIGGQLQVWAADFEHGLGTVRFCSGRGSSMSARRIEGLRPGER